jgi:hypothetical protein
VGRRRGPPRAGDRRVRLQASSGSSFCTLRDGGRTVRHDRTRVVAHDVESENPLRAERSVRVRRSQERSTQVWKIVGRQFGPSTSGPRRFRPLGRSPRYVAPWMPRPPATSRDRAAADPLRRGDDRLLRRGRSGSYTRAGLPHFVREARNQLSVISVGDQRVLSTGANAGESQPQRLAYPSLSPRSRQLRLPSRIAGSLPPPGRRPPGAGTVHSPRWLPLQPVS